MEHNYFIAATNRHMPSPLQSALAFSLALLTWGIQTLKSALR